MPASHRGVFSDEQSLYSRDVNYGALQGWSTQPRPSRLGVGFNGKLVGWRSLLLAAAGGQSMFLGAGTIESAVWRRRGAGFPTIARIQMPLSMLSNGVPT